MGSRLMLVDDGLRPDEGSRIYVHRVLGCVTSVMHGQMQQIN